MACPWKTSGVILTLILLSGCTGSSAQLSPRFYSSSCPTLLPTVKAAVQSAVSRELRMGATLLRLFFHDCFVNGCDASLLLDDTATFTGEKNANPNKNNVRGYDVIDSIKVAVEKVCPGVVSCADVLAIAARDSVVLLGGPSWDVKLGRRDATTASQSAANSNVPSPDSSLSDLIKSFAAHGLSSAELVVLAGAHTIGQARCTFFRSRVYNDSDIASDFAMARRANCPSVSGYGDDNVAPLDLQTPTVFDNRYYINLVNGNGLLHSDQQLFSGGSTDSLVQTYGSNAGKFAADFAAAMIKMGDISPLTGSEGQIRKNCRKIN